MVSIADSLLSLLAGVAATALVALSMAFCLVARWLLFAEGKHVVTLYYG